MDRIYTNDSSDEQLFMEFAKHNNWLYKYRQSYGSDCDITDGTSASKQLLKIHLNPSDYDFYPYMDTMVYYNPDNGVISNNQYGQKYALLSTYGGHRNLINNDTVFSNYHNTLINKTNAKWCILGQDWVLTNEAIKVYNTGLPNSYVYSVPGFPEVVESNIPYVYDHPKHFLKSRCVWSGHLNTWVFENSIVEVYTNKDKTQKVLDHKKRINKSFIKIGEDLFSNGLF